MRNPLPRLEDPPPAPFCERFRRGTIQYATFQQKRRVRRKPGRWFIVEMLFDNNAAFRCQRAWQNAQFETCQRKNRDTGEIRVYARWIESDATP